MLTISYAAAGQCPTAAFQSQSHCLGNEVCFQNNATDTCTEIVESRWYFDTEDTLILPGKANGCHLFTSSGAKTVTLIVENKNGDTDMRQRFVTVLSRPTATASNDTALCPPSSVPISITGSGGNSPYSYAWSPSVGLSCDDCQDPTAFPSNSTDYVGKVIDENGCFDTDTVKVRVSDPNTDAGPDFWLCTGDSVILGGFFPDIDHFSYSWSWTTGTVAPTNSPNPIAVPAGDTTLYELTMNDQEISCTFIDTAYIWQDNTVAFAWPDSTQICAGDSVWLLAAGGVNYTWTPSTGVACPECRMTKVSPPNTTTYNVNVNSGTCDDDAEVFVQVHENPVADAGQDTQICRSDVIKLGGSPSISQGGPPYDIVWTPEALLDNNNIPNPQAAPDTSTIYTLIVEDTNNCVGMDTVAITVNPYPQTHAGPDTTIFKGTAVQLFAADGADAYQWTPATGLEDPATSQNPIASPMESTTYTIRVDSNNCISTQEVTVEIEERVDVFVPSAFTPDGDDHNDSVLLKGLAIADLLEFRIFNRWGEMVYHTTSLDEAMNSGWDGTYKGVPQETGNYVYYLTIRTFEDTQLTKQGTLTLLR